jgi:signal peptidase I
MNTQAPQKSRLRQNVESLTLAILVALVVRSSVVEAFWVPSGSMLPTIQIGDHLFVNKLAYGLQIPFTDIEIVHWDDVRRGDIVVFLSPTKGDGDSGRIDLIKRVMAVGGDTVEIRNKQLYVNGEKVEDTHAKFLDARHQSVPTRDNFGPVKVPAGKIFCLGDNRDHSHDSRYWGFADVADVKGKATFIYWSRASGELPRWERFGKVLR